ncbi:DET1 homolog isoform X6 [Nycticebus coucang]|uniref:DET1 homolog isoform X6 n=1 Tax=Nycticebus coucang TaxID=9470 RepID=UPI00234C1BFB|nr:DET1 homolog isoform X6 [Nycticebus coucang]
MCAHPLAFPFHFGGRLKDLRDWAASPMAKLRPSKGKGLRPTQDVIMDHHVTTIKPRRIQNQNVIHRLERRRISSGKTRHLLKSMSTRAARQQRTYCRGTRGRSCPMAMTSGQSTSGAGSLNDFLSCCTLPTWQPMVTPEGTFIDVRTIGRFCYEDDLLTVSAVFPEVQRDSQTGMANPFRDPFINSLKHRLLVYLWRRAEQDGSAMAKRRFFQYFDQLRQLRMWKMQLLDENHLFIKYTSEDVVTLRVTDPSQASFFVVYNMVTTEVIAVFENTSDELLELFENFCDLFRNATLHSEVQFPCSASSNNFARQIQRRFKDTIINAKYGGHTEAVRRLLGQLPISAQSYSGSPYLDLSLFSYDDKWVSVMERPKTCGDHPIRFYARDSGLLKFEIQAGLLGRPINHTVRRLVAFTFHPFEPFAISVQRTNAEYVVNFHMRHCCT